MRAPAGRGGYTNVGELIARRNYTRAIEVLRQALTERRGEPRLRVQLGETLILAGKAEDGVAMLEQVADDLALSGASAKAIAVLKKIQKADPGRSDIEEKLSYMITQQASPTPDPWTRARTKIQVQPEEPRRQLPSRPDFPGDLEEISDVSAEGERSGGGASKPPARGGEAARAPEPPVLAVPAEKAGPDLDLESAASEEDVGSGLDLESAVSEREFQDELIALIEGVFTPTETGESAARALPAVETPLFRDFTAEELLEIIRGFKLRTFLPGEIIVTEGDPGDSLFVLTSGSVRAYVKSRAGRQVPVRDLAEGDFFGEISVLRGVPRTATITAATRCELLEIERATFNTISQTHPRVWSVLKEFYDKRANSSLEAAARNT